MQNIEGCVGSRRFSLKRRTRISYADIQKVLMWDRWRQGESLHEREAGQTEARISEQLGAVFAAAGPEALEGAIVAYEPVWAIGTGKTASPAQAQEVHAFIRGQAVEQDANIAGSLPILYGGSVKADNAAELFAQPDVDGGLVGGASLLADEFNGIIAAAMASRN